MESSPLICLGETSLLQSALSKVWWKGVKDGSCEDDSGCS